MKIHGQRPAPPKPEVVVIPRESGEIVFTCKPVFDFSPFEKMCPPPKPPLIRHASGEKVHDINDPKFEEQLIDRSKKRTAWMIIKSLEDTEGLEWENVKLNKPSTFESVYDELRDASFSQVEINYLVTKIMSVSSMDEERLEQARKNFIATQAQPKE